MTKEKWEDDAELRYRKALDGTGNSSPRDFIRWLRKNFISKDKLREWVVENQKEGKVIFAGNKWSYKCQDCGRYGGDDEDYCVVCLAKNKLLSDLLNFINKDE